MSKVLQLHTQIETFLSYVPLLDKHLAPSFSLLVEKHDAASALSDAWVCACPALPGTRRTGESGLYRHDHARKTKPRSAMWMVEFGVNPIWLLSACEKPSDPSCLELARNTPQYPFVIAKIPMLHWGKPRCSRRWPIFSDDFKSESARQLILAHSQQGKLPLTAASVFCSQA